MVIQGFQDIFATGNQLLTPIFRGVLDFTTAIMPGGGGNGNGKGMKDAGKKAVKEVSTLKTNGVGLFTGFNRNWIRLAGVSGALAVGLGAYGAHVIMINENVPEDQKHSFRTANMYHFIGTFGIVAASLGRYPLVSGTLMALGMTLFCGSCYYHGLTGDPSIKKVAPFGGTTLIAAWLSLIL